MKAKVIIENGETTIVLRPENEFETDVLEKVYKRKEAYNLNTIVEARYNYGSYDNHKIEISIKELR
jgi:hypothetical protein